MQLLHNDNIRAFNVAFQASDPSSDKVVVDVTLTCDPCGSADRQAQELVQIVQHVKSVTGANKVNIVAPAAVAKENWMQGCI